MTREGKVAVGSDRIAPDTEPREAVLFAPLGSNPALLAAMTWSLWRHERVRVVDAHVVVVSKGFDYLQAELLAPGAGLDQLHAVVGPDVLPRSGLHVHLATLADGTPVTDDLLADGARAYQDAVMRHAQAAVVSAGVRPVVFALLAGRRRSMTVMLGIVAQFCSRSQDRVLDLRVEPRGADVPGLFYFPDQLDQAPLPVGTHGGLSVRPSEVQVSVVEVIVPRLHSLLPQGPPKAYADVLALGQRAVNRAAPLRLELVDGFAAGRALVHDPGESAPIEIPLSRSQFLYLASVVRAREAGTDGGWVAADEALLEGSFLLEVVRGCEWSALCRARIVKTINAGRADGCDTPDARDDVSTLRAKTRRALVAFAKGRDVRYQALIPDKRRRMNRWFERIPLANVSFVRERQPCRPERNTGGAS